MKSLSLICIGLCTMAGLKAQQTARIGFSTGFNYAESYGHYANSSGASIVLSPGVFFHKSWGNWGLYMPLSIGPNLSSGRSAPLYVATIPLFFEMGFNPGKKKVYVHGGLGYTTILKDKAIADNQLINSIHEVHCGVQYKNFDSRLSFGTSQFTSNYLNYSRVTIGLYYYLRK